MKKKDGGAIEITEIKTGTFQCFVIGTTPLIAALKKIEGKRLTYREQAS